MRRTYISPEFSKNIINGTFNILEESNFFSSKMLELEDSILIDNIDILWYQTLTGEQLDISIETTSNPLSYSPSADKLKNSSLRIDQTKKSDIDTKWILNIKLKDILSNYLFSTLKRYRTFEGVKSKYTLYGDVNVSINNYITSNILNRYKFDKVYLYMQERDINEEGQIKYKNNWNLNLKEETIFTKYNRVLNSDESEINLSFTQRSSDKYIFDYYYNIQFTRI